MRLALITLGLATCSLFCWQCSAETRWCTVTVSGTSGNLLYPPIARAAHVSGTVIGHLIFEPSGSVSRLEDVSGPALLAKSVSDQVIHWKVLTDAQGDQPCQSLLVANFTVGDESSTVFLEGKTPSEMLRIAVHAEVLVISDPAGVITTSFWWKMRHLFKAR